MTEAPSRWYSVRGLLVRSSVSLMGDGMDWSKLPLMVVLIAVITVAIIVAGAFAIGFAARASARRDEERRRRGE